MAATPETHREFRRQPFYTHTMRTYTIESPYGTLRLVLQTATYAAMPHNQRPFAIVAKEENPEYPDETYGIVTVNMDPHTGLEDQTGNRAFVKTYGENSHWVPELMRQLEESGAAVRTGRSLENGRGVNFPLYEFKPELL